jgi:hypothetical protein
VIAYTIKLISLPTSYPARKALPHALDIYRYISPLSAVCIAAKERLKPRGSRRPIGNPPWVQPPWTDYSYRVKIKGRSQVIKDAAKIARAKIPGLYVEASVAKRLA